MRVAIIALVLLVIAAFAFAHEPSTTKQIKPIRSRKPRSLSPKQVKILSDLFGKVGQRILNVVRRVAPIVQTVKQAGILSDHVAPKSQKPKSRKPIRDRSRPVKSTKPRSSKPGQKAVKSQKPRSRKPRSLSPKQTKILSDFLGKFGKRIGQIARRVAPIVKKGFEIYKTVKTGGILSDHVAPKSQKPKSRKPAVSRKPKAAKSQKPKSSSPIREKIRAMIAKLKKEKPEIMKPIKEKLSLLKEKLRAAIKKRLANLKSSKPAKSQKPKSSKPAKKAAALSDEKFFEKMKNWWVRSISVE